MTDIKLQFIPHMNTNSCCCFPSKTGCLIIGYVGAILASIYAVGSLIATVSTLFAGDSSLLISFILSAVVSMLILYIHYSLIKGVEEQEPRKMYSWIYLNYFHLIFNIFAIGVCIIILIINLASGKSEESIPIYGKEVLLTNFQFFVSICLYAVLEGIDYHIFAAVVTHCQEVILIKSRGPIYTS